MRRLSFAHDDGQDTACGGFQSRLNEDGSCAPARVAPFTLHLLPPCSSCPYSLSDVSLPVVTCVDIRTVPELQPQELVANGRIIADNNEISD